MGFDRLRAARLRVLAASVVLAGAGLCASAVGIGASTALAGEAALPPGALYERLALPGNLTTEAYTPADRYLESQLFTGLPFQAAAGGGGIAFLAGATVGAGNECSGSDGGNEYIATRSAGGWSIANVSPAHAPSGLYEAFSSDLAVGVLDATEPLSPLAPGFGEAPEYNNSYDVLYATKPGSGLYTPLFSVKPPYRTMETFATAPPIQHPPYTGLCGGRSYNNRSLDFAGASADWSHLLFLANDALTPAAEGRPAAEGGEAGAFASENNLYESVNGQLRLVREVPGTGDGAAGRRRHRAACG